MHIDLHENANMKQTNIGRERRKSEMQDLYARAIHRCRNLQRRNLQLQCNKIPTGQKKGGIIVTPRLHFFEHFSSLTKIVRHIRWRLLLCQTKEKPFESEHTVQ